MTYAQGLSFAVIGGAVAMFVWGRFRYDLIALVALLIGIVTRDVPVKQAFSGFTSDVVVIIASALIVSAAIARSGVIEWAVRPLMGRLHSTATQVPALAGTTALLSMLTKNVGALAIMMPVALRIGRKTETSASSLLMPMAFMSLLGGLVTLVGTSTNIIVSQVRQDTLGKPFQMYDFAPVGLMIAARGHRDIIAHGVAVPQFAEQRTVLAAVTAREGRCHATLLVADPVDHAIRMLEYYSPMVATIQGRLRRDAPMFAPRRPLYQASALWTPGMVRS